MALNESGLGGHLFEIVEHGVEPFYMADLEDEVLGAGEVDEHGGLIGVIGHGLFDEHMFALAEEGGGDVEMRDGGRDDAEGFGGGGSFFERTKDWDMKLIGDFACGFGGVVVDADEIDLAALSQLGIDTRVLFSERASSDDGDLWFHDHAGSVPKHSRNDTLKIESREWSCASQIFERVREGGRREGADIGGRGRF